MSKAAFFGHIYPNFFDDLFFRNPPNFLGNPQNFLPPKNFPPSPNFLNPFRPENPFFRLFRPKKPLFFDLKIFFRLFRPKNFFKSTQFLTKTSFKPSK